VDFQLIFGNANPIEIVIIRPVVSNKLISLKEILIMNYIWLIDGEKKLISCKYIFCFVFSQLSLILISFSSLHDQIKTLLIDCKIPHCTSKNAVPIHKFKWLEDDQRENRNVKGDKQEKKEGWNIFLFSSLYGVISTAKFATFVTRISIQKQKRQTANSKKYFS